MPVFGFLQPLPGDFRSNDVASGSLPVTWGHVTSFPVTWLTLPASYSLVGSKRTVYASFQPSTTTSRLLPVKWCHFRVTYGNMRSRDVISCDVTASSRKQQPCKKSNAQYTPVFGLIQPIPNDFRSNDVTSGSLRSPEVTWRHFLSRHCLLLRATALSEVKRTGYASFRSSTATSRWFLVKWRHLRVTSGHIRSRDVISCHVTASSCKLQPCRKWNVQCTPVFGLPQPLPGDFRSNDVTSKSLPVTWSNVTSFAVTWPSPASNSLVGSQMHSTCQFSAFYSHFKVTSGKWRHFRHLRSSDVISCHVTTSCELQPCRKSNAQYTSVFGVLQWLAGDFQSNDVISGSLTVTRGHATSFLVTWLPPPAGYSLVGSQTHSICQFSAFYSHFQGLPVKWLHFRVTYGHLRSCDVISCHMTASSCKLQPCRKLNAQYTRFRPSTTTSRWLLIKWNT